MKGSVAARSLLGLVLVAAGLLKVATPWEFAEAIANYRVLPAVANQMLGVALPWWEIGAGLLLLLGLWVRASALLAGVLFAGFGLAVGLAMARGLDIDCGCFGTGSSGRVGVRTLVVDLAGLLLSGLVVVLGDRGAATAPRVSDVQVPRG